MRCSARWCRGVGSAIVLNAMPWLELIATIPRYGLNHFFGVSAASGAALFAAAAVVVFGLMRAEDWTIQRVRAIAAHIPRVSTDGAERQSGNWPTISGPLAATED
jgi:hypothetical protein